MSVWVMLKCDALVRGFYCTRVFRTSHVGDQALVEAGTYGWTVLDGELRCPEHVGLVNAPPVEAVEEAS